ncbi:hypothetical protein NQ314_012103 [Rhamnusium bicolor]|uniref:Sucrose-6-phosphate hydrolase n=1 Tax=Rhamnusium bicolor TaxID=1586634 RepID=A0AAV8XDK3_9CUCU|nr:hypothetical protein NQ314_012103 [Rhamnusium bicolor]
MVLLKMFVIPQILIYLTIQQSSCAPRSSDLTIERANEFITQNKNNVKQTYRLKYHAMAPIGWINDPNGFIYFRGEYHLFYQYNPYSAVWDTMHWGHAKSKDLVHWEELPVALAPDQIYDTDGVFSGSAIEKDGKLYVMYTGNNPNGQVQCIAVSEDGIHFEKVSENPVLDASDLPSNAQPQDFRDPKVFKRGDLYYVVTVSKTVNETGQVLLYQSADLINWEFKSILLEGTKEQGIMWECPDLFELESKDVLILSAIQMARSGNDYHNIDSVIEFIGEVDWNEGKMKVESIKELDHGHDFYATQSLLDDKDRRIVIAWMNMWGRTFPTAILNQGWTGAMTLPRELHLKNGYLTQTPIAEIANALQHVTEFKDVTLIDQSGEFNQVAGEVGMLDLVVNLEEAKLFKIELRANENERTILSYDNESKELTIDRTNSGVYIAGGENPPVNARKIEVPQENNELSLQIFLDQSSLEIFVNGGLETLTTTIYPTEERSEIILFYSEGKTVIKSLKFSKIVL